MCCAGFGRRQVIQSGDRKPTSLWARPLHLCLGRLLTESPASACAVTAKFQQDNNQELAPTSARDNAGEFDSGLVRWGIRATLTVHE